MTRRAASGVALLGALGVLALAGCTSGGGTAGGSTAATTSAVPTTSSPTSSSPLPSDSDTATTSAPPTPTSSAPTSTAPTGPTGSPTAPALAACADLDVTATRVPGAAGITYGLISVTNRGTSRCGLPGVPALRLLDASRGPVTAVAAAVGAGGAAGALEPGATASTLLQDSSSTCQANSRSAFVEVQATTAAPKVVVALSLPPCTLSVRPFTPGTQPTP
ncbi:DUF4232 domain-containing protein [Jatrophihabitans sp. YIM 134969]